MKRWPFATGWTLFWALWGIAWSLLVVGCTFIAWNKAPVTVSDRDSHDAATNGRTWDLNISPR